MSDPELRDLERRVAAGDQDARRELRSLQAAHGLYRDAGLRVGDLVEVEVTHGRVVSLPWNLDQTFLKGLVFRARISDETCVVVVAESGSWAHLDGARIRLDGEKLRLLEPGDGVPCDPSRWPMSHVFWSRTATLVDTPDFDEAGWTREIYLWAHRTVATPSRAHDSILIGHGASFSSDNAVVIGANATARHETSHDSGIASVERAALIGRPEGEAGT